MQEVELKAMEKKKVEEDKKKEEDARVEILGLEKKKFADTKASILEEE